MKTIKWSGSHGAVEESGDGRRRPPPRVLLDDRLRVSAVNQRLRTLCDLGSGHARGIPVQDWINLDTGVLFRVHSAFRDDATVWLDRLEFLLPNGYQVSASLHLRLLRGKRGVGLLVTVTDIEFNVADKPLHRAGRNRASRVWVHGDRMTEQ